MDRLADYKGKRVFVTGHTGFKGRWLCEWLDLIGANWRGYSLPHSDTINENLLWFEMNAFEPDIVLHLAGQAIVRESYRDPLTTYSTNVWVTLNVLEWARHWGAGRRIVCVTSDKVYADKPYIPGFNLIGEIVSHAYRPYVETDELGGVDPYSASKAAAELIIASYRDGFGLNVASARAGNCIGGGNMSPDRLIPDAIRAKKAGKPLIIRSPDSSRPWQHVCEPLYGYLLLGLSDICEPFNFGPSESHTVAEVADLVAPDWEQEEPEELLKKSARLKLKESPQLMLNSDKAARLLGWYPRWTFERAIEETMKGYAGKPMADTIRDYLAS